MSGTPFVIGGSEVGGTDVIGGTQAAGNGPTLVFMVSESISAPDMTGDSVRGDES